jgi:hypothetical protein
MLSIPHCLDSRLTDGGKPYALVMLYSPKQIFCFWYLFLLEAERAPGPVRPEGLGK